MSDTKDLLKEGLKAFGGEFKSKIASKKFYAYVIANAMLLVAMFTVKPSGDTVIGFLKLLNMGYWGVQGGIDLFKAGAVVVEKRKNGKNGGVDPQP